MATLGRERAGDDSLEPARIDRRGPLRGIHHAIPVGPERSVVDRRRIRRSGGRCPLCPGAIVSSYPGGMIGDDTRRSGPIESERAVVIGIGHLARCQQHAAQTSPKHRMPLRTAGQDCAGRSRLLIDLDPDQAQHDARRQNVVGNHALDRATRDEHRRAGVFGRHSRRGGGNAELPGCDDQDNDRGDDQ